MRLPVIPEDKHQEVIERAVQYYTDGRGVNAQVEALNLEFSLVLTRTQLENLQKTPKFREILFDASSTGKLYLKAKLSDPKVADKIAKTFIVAMDEGGKDAVRAATAAASIITGKDDTSGEQNQAQNISITLATDDKTIPALLKKPSITS